jgi:glycosyltransferase involved in cell wall biosynthesis
MNLLYITSGRLPTVKAHGYQIVKTCEALARRHQVTLFAPITNDAAELAPEGIHAYYAADNNFPIENRLHVDLAFLRPAHRVWFGLHVVTFAAAASWSTFRRRKRIDVVYSRDPTSLYILAKLGRLLSVPLVHESHHFPGDDHPFQVELAKRLDGLVVVTRGIHERYVDAGIDERRILVEADAVDLKQFDLPLSRDEARRAIGMPHDILAATYTGRFQTMGKEKGIPETIDASKKLLGELPALRFYFVGGPLERERAYRARIAANDLPQERFVFLDKQPVAELPLWLKASDVLLMPHPKNTFYELYVSPLKMYEYMAARRPIVGSKLKAIEETLTDGETALLGEPGDVDALACNIRALLTDPALGERLAARAFDEVKTHTWDERARRIAAFVADLRLREKSA